MSVYISHYLSLVYCAAIAALWKKAFLATASCSILSRGILEHDLDCLPNLAIFLECLSNLDQEGLLDFFSDGLWHDDHDMVERSQFLEHLQPADVTLPHSVVQGL